MENETRCRRAPVSRRRRARRIISITIRASVLYALSAFDGATRLPGRKTKERDFNPGDVMWVPEQDARRRDIGTTAYDGLLVEDEDR